MSAGDRGWRAARRGRARAHGRRRSRRGRGRGAKLVLGAAAGVVLISAAAVLPWRWIPPPTSAFMLSERLAGGAPEQHWVPLEHMSPLLALCVVAAEDQKFPRHRGFDLESIEKALQESRPRGASTISQQVAKNLYLWPGRSFVRKGLEAWLTVWIEALWPKRRILEVYLNVAEFGRGTYGAGAASRRFFGVPPDRLGWREAALLAAVLPSPKRMSAAAPSEYVRGRAEEIERIARGLGTRYIAGI